MNSFEEIYEAVKNSKSVAIFTHIKADGDCIGSGLALYYSIKKLGIKVDVFNAEHIPSNFNFLVKDIIKNQITEKYDLYIAVDSATPKRLGDFAYIFEDKSNNTINIDHHISNTKYGKLLYVKQSSSACEVIFEYFKATNQQIDNDIAEALLSGISTDTGCFKYNSTTSRTHEIASELYKYDIDFDRLMYYLFKQKTKKHISLMQVILDKIQYFYNDKLVISGLNKKEIAQVGATEDDMPRMVDMLVGIEGVEVAITYRQDTDGGYQVSMRSSGKVDVNAFAECFGGGGHILASGCKLYLKEEQVVKILVEKAGNFIE